MTTTVVGITRLSTEAMASVPTAVAGSETRTANMKGDRSGSDGQMKAVTRHGDAQRPSRPSLPFASDITTPSLVRRVARIDSGVPDQPLAPPSDILIMSAPSS